MPNADRANDSLPDAGLPDDGLPDDGLPDDGLMVKLLAVVLNGDDSGAPVDNSIIAKRLGWDLEAVASCLLEAKERSLVWGQRSGDKPAPWFKELEITVQGRRLLRSYPAAS
jgi:hypothetical protein